MVHLARVCVTWRPTTTTPDPVRLSTVSLDPKAGCERQRATKFELDFPRKGTFLKGARRLAAPCALFEPLLCIPTASPGKPGAHTLRVGAGGVCGANRASVAAVSRKLHSMRGPDLCAIRTENGPNGGVGEKSLWVVIRLWCRRFWSRGVWKGAWFAVEARWWRWRSDAGRGHLHEHEADVPKMGIFDQKARKNRWDHHSPPPLFQEFAMPPQGLSHI